MVRGIGCFVGEGGGVVERRLGVGRRACGRWGELGNSLF